MKSMSKSVMREKARLEAERKQKEREAYLSSLSDEEREEFLNKEKESQRKALKTLAEMQALRAMLGKGYY